MKSRTMEQQVQLHRGISRNVLRHGWIPRLRNLAGRFSATLQRISLCCTVRESDTRGITKDIIQAHVNICKKVSEESFCLAPKSVVSEISASSLQPSVKKPENDQLCEGRSSAAVSSTSSCLYDDASDAVDQQSTLASMSLSATSVVSCTDNTDAISETSSKEELSTLKDEANSQGNGMGGKDFNDDEITEDVAVKTSTTATLREINEIDTSEMAKSSANKEDLGVQAVEESVSSGIQCSPSTTEVCSQSDDSGKAVTQVCEETTGSQYSNPDTEELGLQVCQQMTSSETQYEADTSNVSTEAGVAVTSTAIQNTAEMLATSVQAVKDTTTTNTQTGSDTQDMGTQWEDESVSSGMQCSPSTTEICSQSDDSEKKITEMSTQVEVVVETTGSQYSNPDTEELGLQVCQEMTSSETQYEADTSNVSTQAGAAVTSIAIQNTAEMLDTSSQAVKDTTTTSMQAGPETQDMGTQWEDDRTDVNTQTDKDETDKPSFQISNTGIQAVTDTASMSIQAEPDIQDTGTQWEDDRLNVTTQTEKDEKEITTQTDDPKAEDMPSHILEMVNKYVVTLGHNISRAAVDKKFQSFLKDLKESRDPAIEAKAEPEPALADDDTITRNTATEEPNTVSSKADTLEIITVPNSPREEKDERGISSITTVERSDDSTPNTVEVSTPDTTDVKLDEFLKPGAKSTFVKLPDKSTFVKLPDKSTFVKLPDKSTFVKPPDMQFKKRPPDEYCLPSKQHGESYFHLPTDMDGNFEPSSQSDTENQHIFRTLHLSQSETALGINTDIHDERISICGKSDVRVVKSQTSLKNIKVDDLLKELQSMHQMMCNSSTNLQCSDYSNPELRTANTADEITASSSQNEGHEQSCQQTSMDNIHHGTTDALYSLGFRNIGPASNAQSLDFVMDFWQTPDQSNDAADTSGENVCPQGQPNAACFLNEQNTGKGASAELTEVSTLDIEDISVELVEPVKKFAPVNRTSSEIDIPNISREMVEESVDFENQSMHQMMCNSSANLQCSDYSNPELRTANTEDEITASSSQNERHEQSCLQTSMGNIHHGTKDALYSLGFRNIGPASNAQSFDFVMDFWQTPDQSNDSADTSGENVCPQGQTNAACFLNEQNTGKGASAELTELSTLDIEDISVELVEPVKEFAPVNGTSSEIDIPNISREMAEESVDFENQSMHQMMCNSSANLQCSDYSNPELRTANTADEITASSSQNEGHEQSCLQTSMDNIHHGTKDALYSLGFRNIGPASNAQSFDFVMDFWQTPDQSNDTADTSGENVCPQGQPNAACFLNKQNTGKGASAELTEVFTLGIEDLSVELVEPVKEFAPVNRTSSEIDIPNISREMAEESVDFENQRSSETPLIMGISDELAEAMQGCEKENHESSSTSVVARKKSSDDLGFPLPGTGWLKQTTSIPYFALLDHDPPNKNEHTLELRGTKSESNLDSTKWNFNLKSVSKLGSALLTRQPALTQSREESGQQHEPPDTNDIAINAIGCVQEIQNTTQDDDMHVIEEGKERLGTTANIVTADQAEKMECNGMNDSEDKVSLTTTIPHDKEPATNDAGEVEKAKSSNQVINYTREDKDDMVASPKTTVDKSDHSSGSSADGKTPDLANFNLDGVKKAAVNDGTSIDVPKPSFKEKEQRFSDENILSFEQNAECHSHIPTDIPGDKLISQSDPDMHHIFRVPCMSQSQVMLTSDMDTSGEDIYSTSDERLVRSVSNQKINVDNLLKEFHSNTSISLQCSDGSDSEIRKANIADEMISSENDKHEESWPQTLTDNDYHRTTDALHSLGFRNIGPASNSQSLDLVMNSWKIPDQGNDAANTSTDVASFVMADKAEMMESNRLCESEYQMTFTTTVPDDKEPDTNDAAEVEKAQPSKNKVIKITEVSRENKDDESISTCIKTIVDKTGDSTEGSINVNTESQSDIPTDMPGDNNLINQSDPDMRHILRVLCMSQSEVKLRSDTDTSGEDICGTSDTRPVNSVSNQKKINVDNLLKEFQSIHQMKCNTSENIHCSDNSDSDIRNGNMADEMTASSSQHEEHEQICSQTLMDNANCGTTDALYSLGFRNIGQASNAQSLDFVIDSWQRQHQGNNGAGTSRDGPNLRSEPYGSLNEQNSGKVASVQLTEIYIIDRDSDLTEASTDFSKQTQSSSGASFVVISEEPSSRSASISVISENPLPRPKSNQYIPFMDHDPPNSKEFAMQLRGTKSESNLDSTKWNLKSIINLGIGLLLQQPTPTPNTEESDQRHEPPVRNEIVIVDLIERLQRIQESNQADGMQLIQECLRPLENLVRTDNTGIEEDPAVESTESISIAASSSQNVHLYLDLPQTSACMDHETVQGDSSTNLENVTPLPNNSAAFTNNNEFDNGFDHWYSYDQGLKTVYKHGDPRASVEDNARNSNNGEDGESCSTSHEHKTDVDKQANLLLPKNGTTSIRTYLSQATEGGEIQSQHPSETSITDISGDSEFGEAMEDSEIENQCPSETSIIYFSGKLAKTMEECEIQTEKSSESNMGISGELAEAMEDCELQSQASSEAANMSKSGKHAEEIKDSENTNHPCKSVVGKKSSSDFQGFSLPGTGWLKRTTSIPYFALLDHDPPDTKELALELRGTKSDSNLDSAVWKFDSKSSVTIGIGLPTQQTASSLRNENHGQENDPPERNNSDIHSMGHQPDLQNSMHSDDAKSTVGCQKGSPLFDEQATKKLSESPKQKALPIRTTETSIVRPCENHIDNPSSDRCQDFTEAATISVTQPKHQVNRFGRYELFEQQLPGSNVVAVQIHEHESKRDRHTDPRGKSPDFGPASSAVVELQDFPKDNSQSKLQHHNNSPDTDDCNGILHPGNLAYQSAGVQIFEQTHPGTGITTVQIVENRMPGNFAGNEDMHMQYVQELQNCQQIAPDNRLSDGRDIHQESHGSSLVKNRDSQEELPLNELHFAESTHEDVHITQRSANEEPVRNDQEEHQKSNASTHNPTRHLGSCECSCCEDLQELPRNELHFAESIQEEDHITQRSANEEPARNEEHQTKSNGSTHNLTRHLRSCECPCCKDMQELLASGLKMHQDFLPEAARSRQLQELQPESSKERVTEFQEELSLNEPLPIEYMPDVIIPAEKSSSDSFVFAGSSITSSVVHSSDSDAAPQIMYTDEYLEATNIDALDVESLPADTESNESWMNVCRHSSSHIGVPETGESSSDTSDSWLCVEIPECSGQEVFGRETVIGASGPPHLQGNRRNASQQSEEDKVRLDEKINSKVSSRHTQF